MKSKATGCGVISTVISSIVLLCVSSIIVIIVIRKQYSDIIELFGVQTSKQSRQSNLEQTFFIKLLRLVF